ncbi:hypothetical protein NLJ89_g8797 [Agrocybe chaxingu]|uniref:Uncharacterized protein n=1 Tax=Agrocybe chaxingu TaxID=84603 RepID=A0A9W8MTR4_9AGAR|nr:hypothetical protein NLJ89_g8797 [Agrocybe chaxingu]
MANNRNVRKGKGKESYGSQHHSAGQTSANDWWNSPASVTDWVESSTPMSVTTDIPYDGPTVMAIRQQLLECGANHEDLDALEDPATLRLVTRALRYAQAHPEPFRTGYQRSGERYSTSPGSPGSRARPRPISRASSSAHLSGRSVSRGSPVPSNMASPTSSYSTTPAWPAPPSQESVPAPSKEDRPPKRRRRGGSGESIGPTVIEIRLPELRSPVERGIEKPLCLDESMIEALRCALAGVERRLSGQMPEDDPRPGPSEVQGYEGGSDEDSEDSEVEHHLNYDRDYMPPPDRPETSTEALIRLNRNKHAWKKIRARYVADIEKAQRHNAEAEGYLWMDRRRERPHHLHNVGDIWEPVFHIRNENIVLVGPAANRAVAHIANRERAPLELPPTGPTYHAAPGGFPATTQEVDALIKQTRNRAVQQHYRLEAHVLLQSFYRATLRIDASLYDESMRHISKSAVFDPLYFPEFISNVDAYARPATLVPNGYRRPQGPHTSAGYGLIPPADSFDLEGWAHYLSTHHNHGVANAVNGIIMDTGGRVLLETVFGYRLVQTIGPTSRPARIAWNTAFTNIVAQPQYYAEQIEAYNAENPTQPFTEALGPVKFQFNRSSLTDTAARNLTERDILLELIRNGIPVSWINHLYAYGVRYLDQTYDNTGRSDNTEIIDDDRMARLRRFGTPPTLIDQSGWWAPSVDDVRRLKHMFYQNADAYNLDDPYWVPYGGDYLFPVLISRMGRIASFDVPSWNPNASSATMTATASGPASVTASGAGTVSTMSPLEDQSDTVQPVEDSEMVDVESKSPPPSA